MPAPLRLLPFVIAATGLASAFPIPPEAVTHAVFGAKRLDPLQIDDPVLGSQLQLDFEGFENLSYQIRSSADLQSWRAVGVATVTGGSAQYSEPFPAGTRTFYEAVPLLSADFTPPTWPVGPVLVADAVGAQFVELDWLAANDNTGILAYALYLDCDHVATLTPGELGTSIPGLRPNTVYQFDLFACDAGGNCVPVPGGLTLRTRVEQEPYRNPPRHQSVYLGSGEFTLTRTDLAIKARELGFVFTRTYRSDFEKAGPLGYGWTANIFERLRVRSNGDVVWIQGTGRSDTFIVEPTGGFLSPPGVFSTLINAPGGYQLLAPNGTKRFFGPLGRLQSITTRNGNVLTFNRAGGQLNSVTDDMGRETTLSYDASQRLQTITDFTGREVRFNYDHVSNLISASSPLVIGTPNGNDFPTGKSERYVYDHANSDPDLAHNLLRIIAPNEVADGSLTASHLMTYGSGGPLHDRVLTETRGGTNASGVPAGGTTTYTYSTQGNGSIAQTTVIDPRGNEVVHLFGPTGHHNVLSETLAGRPSPVTTYSYDAEGRLLTLTRPEGDVVTNTYDSASHLRRSQGNLLSVTHSPGPRGASQPTLTTTYTYEPIYNQLRTVTDPRGNTSMNTFDYEEACDVAAIGTQVLLSYVQADAYLAAAGMCIGPPPGDLNGDADSSQLSGNVIRKDHPTVSLDPASNQALLEGDPSQDIIELWQFNQFGQVVAHRDAEFNLDLFAYHPEADPDGNGAIDNPSGDPTTGGYLSAIIRDALADPNRNSGTNPPPTAITTAFAYNPRGVLTSSFNPRGVETRRVLNILDQPVQILRVASTGHGAPNPPEPLPLTAFAFQSEFFYDANNNLVRTDREDRGNTSNTGGFVTASYEYDILDRLLATTEEIDSATTRTIARRYDPNGNLALVIQPEGNAVAYEYDERNLVIATITGTQAPPPEAQVAGAATFNPRGGLPATVRFHYDDNGNRDSITDAADTDGSPANNGPSGGDLTTFTYDGYDRLVRTIDPVGNVAETAYDPNGNAVRIQNFGPDGGPTPSDNTPSTNLLAETRFVYDELNRLAQTDRLLFANTLPGADIQEGATSLGKGDLVPGDGAVNTRYEYDAVGRHTFTAQDDGDVFANLYDGAGRLLRAADPAGNLVEYAYDDAGNVIETRETDTASIPAVADEIVLTTTFYDALNRPTAVVDNLGHTTRFEYDSRDNLLATSDANGPLTGPTITRRVFPDGPLTVNTTNDHGNVSTFTYDGLDRHTSTTRLLTASGLGDGTLTPSPDPAQGGGDGLITTTVDYDLNSLINGRGDDHGFRTTYTYDNLNRRLTESRGVCPGPAPAGYTCDPVTTITFAYDPDHNLLGKTDEIGTVLTYTHDALNRRLALDVTPGPGVVGTTRQEFAYDGLGRLTRSLDDNGDAANDGVETLHAYDSLSRPLRETLTADPASAAGQTSHAWRAANLRSHLAYPDGRLLAFAYDARDRLVDLRNAGADTAIAQFDYIGAGRLLETRFPGNGTRHTTLDDLGQNVLGYDGMRRAIGVRDLDAANGVLTGFTHSYDRLANRLTEQKLHDTVNSETYQYDSAYRLIDLDRPAPGSAPLLHSAWQIDGNNNWNQVDTETRLHSSFNEIVGSLPGPVTVTSDDNGNVTGDGTGTTYQWDAFNRLLAVQSGGIPVARYFYDAAGRRVRVENTNLGPFSGITEYFYDGADVLEERDAVGTTTRQFVFGPETDHVLRLDDLLTGDSFHYHRNTLGSTFALSDGTGGVAERYRYDAYGKPEILPTGPLPLPLQGPLPGAAGPALSPPPLDNPYLFTGRRYDHATGNYYYRARYLNPEQGRFLARDPLGIWGDPANRGNAYAYCANNPINCTDPSGNSVIVDFEVRLSFTNSGTTRDSFTDGTADREAGLHSMDGSDDEFMSRAGPGSAFTARLSADTRTTNLHSMDGAEDEFMSRAGPGSAFTARLSAETRTSSLHSMDGAEDEFMSRAGPGSAFTARLSAETRTSSLHSMDGAEDEFMSRAGPGSAFTARLSAETRTSSLHSMDGAEDEFMSRAGPGSRLSTAFRTLAPRVRFASDLADRTDLFMPRGPLGFTGDIDDGTDL